MVLLCDVGQVQARSVPLEIVLLSVQDSYMACAECTMGI
jgi:hypothetical protein